MLQEQTKGPAIEMSRFIEMFALVLVGKKICFPAKTHGDFYVVHRL